MQIKHNINSLNFYILLAEVCFLSSIFAAITLNYASNNIVIVVLMSVFVGLMSTTTNLVISVIVNLFPTSLR